MTVLIICIGLLIAISVFLMLQGHLAKLLIGLALMSTVINLAILLSGRVHKINPAFIDGISVEYSNPLTQAMVLTAIVIGFGFIAYLATLLKILLPSRKPS